jgi:regulator of sigma E protease
MVESRIQGSPPNKFGLKLKRGSDTVEVTLQATPDTTLGLFDRGLQFSTEQRIQKADGTLDALGMGAYRTLRAIKSTYQQLYSLISGRTSVKLLSGPISLARATYIFAGQGPWKLVVLLGLISINLAVVNFLPIPVLDGGHMVLLIYEAIRGKQAPESVQTILIYIGLAAVGSLMLLAVGMDLWRLFF